MKLGKAMSVEHIKRMTLRTVRESNEGQPEFLSFMTALERNDFDENLCKREARHLEQVMTAKSKRQAAEHRSTLNFHVIRMMKSMRRNNAREEADEDARGVQVPVAAATAISMEAIHQDAHLLKENVEATVGGAHQNKLRFGGDKTRTPKRRFQIHSDAESSGKKGLKDSTSEKRYCSREKSGFVYMLSLDEHMMRANVLTSACVYRSCADYRRVLGDISNQHRNRRAGDGPEENAARKKKSVKSGVQKSEIRVKTPVSKRAALSQIKPTEAPAPATKPAEAQAPTTQPAQVDEVEEIEHAYGGLPSLKPSASYLASLREEMINDIIHNKTPSLIDDYETSGAFGVWDNGEEHKMLESGAVPSAWWSQATAEYAEDTSADPLWNDTASSGLALLDDVPAPDDFSDPSFDENENDDLLDELLNVDVDAACQ